MNNPDDELRRMAEQLRLRAHSARRAGDMEKCLRFVRASDALVDVVLGIDRCHSRRTRVGGVEMMCERPRGHEGQHANGPYGWRQDE